MKVSTNLSGITAHQDLRPDNILWNAEQNCVMIIDFHCSRLDPRPDKNRPQSARFNFNVEARERKRLRML
ncbi:hypothetical protein BDV27DRAFT_137517 [Aspergillus caelatus]|uniref:Protein kinase domain-containing protein n=1 Tax=Aspergillus caelatus TaxID=61420 RepID=A0A5N6ZNM2_9EURO|nr:uncharacterized protein BDV27DRAFT_137517 [Aspergillus caelatus]KAE8358566.1 hypothetical protein BDV27DRAFT_137517 [Aspergillus caelatus]